MFGGVHRVAGQGGEGGEDPAHAGGRNKEPQPQHPGVGRENAGDKAQRRHQGADADHPQRRPFQFAHHQLRGDQRHPHQGQGNAGGLRRIGRAHAQAVEGEEAHGDLRHGHAQHRDERHHQRPAQARVAQAHRLGRLLEVQFLARQPCLEEGEAQQRQHRQRIERQAQAVARQQCGKRRPQDQPAGVGRPQGRHGPGAMLGFDVVGDQRIAAHRDCRIEHPDQPRPSSNPANASSAEGRRAAPRR